MFFDIPGRWRGVHIGWARRPSRYCEFDQPLDYPPEWCGEARRVLLNRYEVEGVVSVTCAGDEVWRYRYIGAVIGTKEVLCRDASAGRRCACSLPRG